MPQFRTPRSRPDHCSSSGFSFEKLVNLLQIIGGTPTLEDGSQKASRVMVSGRHTFIRLKSHLPWTFSPPATQGHRPDEPGHPFQPTATSLRTLLRRQPFPYPRRLHNCQETCPGLLVFRTSFNSMVFACARCRRNCWLATIFHRMFSRLASHYATNAQRIGCTVQLNTCLLQLQARYR
ncbi:hypothetical protein CTAM01_01169 [Colletotrichum tamarilloi]|uniref:Uncharacterized protein n=1 Tax=Colletotrichum tamarilloi TaxID=1209934 RepID=A0ABQ9RTC6_9PEZI|nr:uncharacterized protein CTAM01_01169 [Colletotrichum tamarilloi]KAK1512239.1 hypothetical protein CTAM01_01169 [Colletotrichum tamarilloi]